MRCRGRSSPATARTGCRRGDDATRWHRSTSVTRRVDPGKQNAGVPSRSREGAPTCRHVCQLQHAPCSSTTFTCHRLGFPASLFCENTLVAPYHEPLTATHSRHGGEVKWGKPPTQRKQNCQQSLHLSAGIVNATTAARF